VAVVDFEILVRPDMAKRSDEYQIVADEEGKTVRVIVGTAALAGHLLTMLFEEAEADPDDEPG
jgi:hypothetical protein